MEWSQLGWRGGPAGTYLVGITAQGEGGQQVTALRPVSITR